MQFKKPEMEKQLKHSHPILQKLVKDVDKYCRENFLKEIMVTAVARTREDSIRLYSKEINPKTNKPYFPPDVPISVHEVRPCRGLDIRSFDFTSNQRIAIKYYVNSHYLYNPEKVEKRCCLYHKTGDSSFHFHLQVSDKTLNSPLTSPSKR